MPSCTVFYPSLQSSRYILIEMPTYIKDIRDEYEHEMGDLVRLMGRPEPIYGLVTEILTIVDTATDFGVARRVYSIHFQDAGEDVDPFYYHVNGGVWWDALELEPMDSDKRQVWYESGGERALQAEELQLKMRDHVQTVPFKNVPGPSIPQAPIPPVNVPLTDPRYYYPNRYYTTDSTSSPNYGMYRDIIMSGLEDKNG